MENSFQYPAQTGFLTVIIPVGVDADGLKITLDSLSRQTWPREMWEILVANDGSCPLVSEVCAQYDGVREIQLGHSLGSYAARNAALRESSGEYLAFTDGNVSCPPTWCEQGMKALQEADYLGGPVVHPATKNPSIAMQTQMLFEFSCEKFLTVDHFVVTANLFVRRKVLESVGFFNGTLRSCGDWDFGCRVYRSGKFRQAFIPDLQVEHPFRNLLELLRKEKRVAYGTAALHRTDPSEYRDFQPRWSRSLALAKPGRLMKNWPPHAEVSLWGRLGIFIVRWLQQLTRAYYGLPWLQQGKIYVDPPQRVRPLRSG